MRATPTATSPARRLHSDVQVRSHDVRTESQGCFDAVDIDEDGHAHVLADASLHAPLRRWRVAEQREREIQEQCLRDVVI